MSTSSRPPGSDLFFQAVVRKAEKIYSKLELHRDESGNLGRRKKSPTDEETKSSLWEDTTDVSIVALRGFLEDLLGVQHSKNTADNSSFVPIISPDTPYPVSQQKIAASNAAKAYQTTGRIVHDENVDAGTAKPIIPTRPMPSSDTELGEDFGEGERDKMHEYIRDLTQLERQGITQLTLRRSLTFLESIHQAIEGAKF